MEKMGVCVAKRLRQFREMNAYKAQGKAIWY